MSAAPSSRPELRFVFDQHVNGPALRQLREREIDVVHVAEVGMAAANDLEIFRWAIENGRIVVTRNCRDFAPLAEAFARQGTSFPGVLFFATSVKHSDMGHHVRALLEWAEAALSSGRNPVKNGFGWLRLRSATGAQIDAPPLP